MPPAGRKKGKESKQAVKGAARVPKEAPVVSRRGRGRPRKVDMVDTPATQPITAAAIPLPGGEERRGRGRPPKKVKKDDHISHQTTTAAAPRRKGRAEVESDSDDTSGSRHTKAAAPPRRRGSPAEVENDIDDAPGTRPRAAASTRRGSKRTKAGAPPTDHTQDQDEEVAEGRGRKRMKHRDPNLTPAPSESMDDTQDISDLSEIAEESVQAKRNFLNAEQLKKQIRDNDRLFMSKRRKSFKNLINALFLKSGVSKLVTLKIVQGF